MAKKLKAHPKGSLVAFGVCLVGGALIGALLLDNMGGGISVGFVAGVVVAAFIYVK